MPGFEAMRSDRGMTANLVELELVPVEFPFRTIFQHLQPWKGLVANDGHRSLGEVCHQHKQYLDRLGDTLLVVQV